ncbi:MAG: hypothetical protein EXQ91_06685 [Alphaproteobacteria bacterium]|nr:hypothetical protein [Alphaproteobacteria bacterium]
MKPTAVAVCIAFAAAGCAQTASVSPTVGATSAAIESEGLARFTDVAVPPGAKMDLDRSLLLGAAESWTGRLYLDTSQSVNELFEFYRRTMPKLGWAELTVIRASTSILTFVRDDRVATVQVARSGLLGSSVSITVAPKRGQQQ